MDQRVEFIQARLSGRYASMAELCRAFRVSCKTGYKWRKRFEEGGLSGLAERSRRCHEHSNSTDPTLVAMVVAARKRHPTRGRRSYAWLGGKGYEPPARSTISAILRLAGLAYPKRIGECTVEYADGLSAQDRPN